MRGDVRDRGPLALIGVLHGPRFAAAEPHVFSEIRPPDAVPIRCGLDYPKDATDPDALIRVAFVGAHMLAHDVRLLDALGDAPWRPAAFDCSEDTAFERRVHEIGGGVWCDVAVPVWHYDENTRHAFLPGNFAPCVIGADGMPVRAPGDEASWRAQGLLTEPARRSYGGLVDSRMKPSLRKKAPIIA